MKQERMLFFVVIGITVLISILLFIRYSKKLEGFGEFYRTEDKFTKEQRSAFHDKLNKSLPVNSGLLNEMKQLNKTLFSVDTMINNNTMAELPPFSPENDPLPAFRARNEAECTPIDSPMYLKPHTNNSPVSCGWYYLDDDNKTSLATLGTEKAPIDPDFMINNPGGQWVWNNEQAQKLEDAKKCRKIKSYETADIYPNECGFCPSLSRGVPIKNGLSKYDNDPNLTCDVGIITNPSAAPPSEPTTKVVITDSGEILSSGDIHLGEVIPFNPPNKGICDPNPKTGTLNIDCLISLAKAIGYSENGVLIKVLLGDEEGYYTKLGPNYDMMRITKNIFETDASFKLRGEYFGDGPINRSDVLYGYKKIYDYVKKSSSKRIRNAAAWIVYGNEYDPCDYDSNKVGPFDPLCQERVALEAGCQRDGYKFPGPDSWANYNLLKWSAFTKYFKDMYQTMNNSDPNKQRQANLDCLGISVVSDVAISCGSSGAPCKVLTEAEIQRSAAVVSAQSNIDKYKAAISTAKTPIEKKLAAELYEEAVQVKAAILVKIRKANVRTPIPPIGSWDFNLGRSDDRMRKYGSNLIGSISYTTMGGKQCARFQGPGNYISIDGAISTRDFKSISMMIYVNSNGPYPRLWDFNNSSLGGSWCADNLFGCLSPVGSSGISMYAMTNCDGPSIWTQINTTPYGQWIHVVWTIDPDYTGMTVYLNGQQRARWSDPNGKKWIKDKVYKNAWIMQSPELFDKDVGVAWFRIFDYTLTAEAIAIDMADGWANKTNSLSKPITYLPLINDAKDYGSKKQVAKTSGNVQFSSVASKQCAYFNNNMSTWVAVGNAVNKEIFTVCFWMLLKSGGYYTVVSRTDSTMNRPVVQFDVVAGNMPLTAYLALPNAWTRGASQNTGMMQLNIWYHVALVVSGINGTMYINGIKQGTGVGSSKMPVSDIWVLGRSGDSGRAADVCLRQFALWDYELTQKDINSVMNQTSDSKLLTN